MDIKILDSWLRQYLLTEAKPAEIAKYLSLCGPSVERINRYKDDYVYDIEITTNRIDSASVYGIAREASAILPRFGIKAKLLQLRSQAKEFTFTKNVSYLNVNVDKDLCPRFTAVLIKDVKIDGSPEYIKSRLEGTGVRSINNIVDISNYIMLELGQPVHTFDYDKIEGHKMVLRQSRKGEVIETLDGKNFELPGGDIVIEDGKGRLIDLAGIMGGGLSSIDNNTKNVLLFVQNYKPGNIRKTSMALAQRTMAAAIFEKGTDAELVSPAILEALSLFKSLTKGVATTDILNIYPHPYKSASVSISLDFINQRLGIEIPKKEVTEYLSSLGFECHWVGKELITKIPSFRSKDMTSPEDLLEEIARIYGYHNLPSTLMNGGIPDRPADPKFTFESNLKDIISGFGGTEVYTLSLVPKDFVDEKHLKLKNPLGPDTEYLRTSLRPSLVKAAADNTGVSEKFHLFEIANTYIPKTGDLPEERLILAGIFSGYSYRKAKGVLEALFLRLYISVTFEVEESKGFDASKCASILHKGKNIGKFGVTEDSNLIYYEIPFDSLIMAFPPVISFKPITKYPSQIEDINFVFPQKTKIGKVLDRVKEINLIENADLIDIYKDSYTFRVWYHDKGKTLTDKEVEVIRKQIISSIKETFGGSVKE